MQKISQWFHRVMSGRYGTDKLNMFLLGVGVVTSILSLLIPSAGGKMFLVLLSYVFLFYALFRCFSRNTYKRYQENRKYLQVVTRFKDRQHRYFACPKCRQTVRVPRRKGKISITCPRCKEKFVKKT